MIFAFSTDDRSLMVFFAEAEAIAYCEGIDVEEGGWLFFGNDGSPLEPHFSKPSRRGVLVVESGEYTLLRAPAGTRQPLRDYLHEVVSVEGMEGICNVTDVERLLADNVPKV